MAEYCARCGKKIGFLGGINELFPDKKGRGVCDDCEKDFKFKIDVEIQDWARKVHRILKLMWIIKKMKLNR